MSKLDLLNPVRALDLDVLHADGEAANDGLADVRKRLLQGVALGVAARHGGHLGPEAALFRLMDDYLDLHARPLFLGRAHLPRVRALRQAMATLGLAQLLLRPDCALGATTRPLLGLASRCHGNLSSSCGIKRRAVASRDPRPRPW